MARSVPDEGGENEPMLGGRPSLDSLGPPDPTSQNSIRSSKPTKSAAFLKTVAVLCGISLIILSSFIFLQFFRAQQHPSEPQQHGGNAHAHSGAHDGQLMLTTSASVYSTKEVATTTTSDLPSATPSQTTIAQPAAAIVSLQDQLDLKTGFVVSKQRTIREYVFNITRELGSPDGYEKTVILVNGQSPGPLIEANTGDTIRVVVHNKMFSESTTIHWHGIDQRNSSWMDGVVGISQCGIPPGESFTYEFTISNQRGTFWYHSHLSVQYADGLYGPLIIHDPGEQVPEVQDEKIIMIGDLYHRHGEELLADYLGPAPPWSPDMPSMEPPPDNIVFNGQHVSNCSAGPEMDHGMSGMQGMNHGHGTRALGTCAAGSLYSTRVKTTSRVRLRVISHSTNTPYYFTVDNHTLEITEIDGTEIKPLTTTRLFMNPGQRYSVILHANQTAGNYLMRAAAASHCFHLPGHMHQKHGHGDSGLANIDFEATALLTYDDTDISQPTLGLPWDVTSRSIPGLGKEPWRGKCHDIPFDIPQALRQVPAYEVGSRNYHHFKYKTGYNGDVWRTFINSTIYTPLQNDAALWQSAHQNATSLTTSGSQGTRRDQPVGQHTLVSQDPDQGAQIVINSQHMMSHPWHLHGTPPRRDFDCSHTDSLPGQNFQIVGWGSDLYGKGKTTWNLKNPLRRDTVTVPGDSHVVIRISGDNPGIWALHCHILWHAEGGMGVALAQRLDQLQLQLDALDQSQGAENIRNKFCSASLGRPTLPPRQQT